MAVKNTRKLRGLEVFSYLEDEALYFIAFERGTTSQLKVYECVTFSDKNGIADFQCHVFQN